jgi:uncharacterized protein (DUF1499 family)
MPMIHDVSTDPDDPPQFIALRDTRLACKNGVEYSGLRGAAHHQRYPDITPLICAKTAATLYQGALAAIQSLGWAIAGTSETEGRIEATATTRILRFKDDVVIRIRTSHDGTRLDLRSASRVGRSDLGANAKRIRAFLLELNIHLLSTT